MSKAHQNLNLQIPREILNTNFGLETPLSRFSCDCWWNSAILLHEMMMIFPSRPSIEDGQNSIMLQTNHWAFHSLNIIYFHNFMWIESKHRSWIEVDMVHSSPTNTMTNLSWVLTMAILKVEKICRIFVPCVWSNQFMSSST
jgi:hypothetical protein